GGRRPQPAPAGVHRPRRVPVRVLHAGDAHGGDRAPRGRAAPEPRAGDPRARGQPLPLHRLRADRGGGAGGRRGARLMRRVVTRPEVPAPIGLAVPRRDGVPKVTGTARFTVDVDLPGMAHARILRSPYPHARITSIDVTAARAHPGVIAVVSA